MSATPTMSLPNPQDLLQAPMSVLDAQVKAMNDQLSNLFNISNTGVQSVFGVLQSPFSGNNSDAVKTILNAPLTLVQAMFAPLKAPTATPAAGTTTTTVTTTNIPATTPNIVTETTTLISNVGGLFNVVKP